MASHSSVLLVLQLLMMITMAFSQSRADRDLPVLLKIKEQFGNPAVLAGWRPGSDCNTWSSFFAFCNEQGRVVDISLGNVDINSTLPPAIGELDQLHTLSIGGMPGLHGPIPDSFGNLAHLSVFNLMVTSVSGPIPASLARTNLTSVSFYRSRLSGRIPPELCRLPYLTFFDASYNDLEGPIPPLLVRGSAPDRPVGLTLDGNRLSGEIPWTYMLEQHWTYFTVAGNRLTSDASFLFGRRKVMYGAMDLSGNRLRFNLTGLEIPRYAMSLNLSHNRIYGGVPASLRTSRVLTLDLSYNELCGEIPTGGRMEWFKAAAYAHNKCLCGAPLPPCATGGGH